MTTPNLPLAHIQTAYTCDDGVAVNHILVGGLDNKYLALALSRQPKARARVSADDKGREGGMVSEVGHVKGVLMCMGVCRLGACPCY